MFERVHGGIDADELAALGLARGDVLDLSVNVNPLGPHPHTLAAAAGACLGEYPDPSARAARQAIAAWLDVDPARVLIGHGSAELLWCAIGASRAARGPLLVVTPTFGEPLAAARAYGLPVVCMRTREADAFALDPTALADTIAREQPALVYLCQPNNPTGSCTPAVQLRAVCQAHPRCQFVIDQAFLSLSTRHADAAVAFPDNTLVVRSLTKDFALPGLRVGFALGAPARLQQLQAQRPAWMVSAPAQAAIVAACAHPQHAVAAREYLLPGRAALARACEDLGLRPVPSQTHFFVMRAGAADALRGRLLARHAVLVRSCRSFGLPEHIRVAGCGPEQRVRLLRALAAELSP